MPDKDNLARFAEFARAVNARLEAGRASYGDASFSRHPAVLCGEVEQELLDVCGWAYVLWTFACGPCVRRWTAARRLRTHRRRLRRGGSEAACQSSMGGRATPRYFRTASHTTLERSRSSSTHLWRSALSRSRGM